MSESTERIDAPVGLEQSFAVLSSLVARADERGISPTAATLKLQLMREIADFDERRLGFPKFKAFLQAAEEAGLVTMSLDNGGHPRLSPGIGQSVTATKLNPVRLRRDVWTAFVTWEQPTLRYWDQEARRAIVVPVTPDNVPLWEAEPGRFVSIEPLTMDQQIALMHEFANSLQDIEQRESISSTIGDLAPPGAFRAALSAARLNGKWSGFLQSRVAQHASAWARAAEVPARLLFEPIRRNASRGSSQNTTATASAPTPHGGTDDTSTVPAGPTAQLRARLHSVIDQMSPAELASLRIPAAYLID